MLNYLQIDQLFGAPLDTVPKPRQPFKLKTWQIVSVSLIVILAFYGANTIYKNIYVKKPVEVKK